MSTSICNTHQTDPDRFHRGLAAFNHYRLQPGVPAGDWDNQLRVDLQWKLKEGSYIESQLEVVRASLPDVPKDPLSFMAWFESLCLVGPGQNDPLFVWLAEDSSLEEMRWFLRQEIGGEAGFDDLVALTQVRFPDQAKLELARNYWDEMGQGHARGMHGPLLERIGVELELAASVEDTVWEALALSNVMVALASNRRYAFHSIGALGVVEMTAPARVGLVNKGLKRLGVSSSARRYFQLHAGLDVKHSLDWNREVILPLVRADPNVARLIGEGAWLRLQCGLRSFKRYREKLTTEPAAVPA